MEKPGETFYFIIGVLTAMVGYQMHKDVLWAIIDFLFWPIAVIKWLICHELNLSIIKETFSFFFK